MSPVEPSRPVPPYAEGERVFGPPQGTFDPEWAARLLLDRLPGLAWDEACGLAEAAWAALRAVGRPDAGAVTGRLAEAGTAGDRAAAAAAVAVALVESYEVDLRE